LLIPDTLAFLDLCEMDVARCIELGAFRRTANEGLQIWASHAPAFGFFELRSLSLLWI
jgi:hypothetical protein